MAESSSAPWEEALLARLSPQRRDALARQLERDPPLVLWAACLAQQSGGPALKSIDEVAHWLVFDSVETLAARLSGGEDVPVCCEDGDGSTGQAALPQQAVEELLQASLEAAHRAAAWAVQAGAEPDGPRAASPAYLAGMLHNARAWLLLVASEPERAANVLPDWLQPLVAGWEGAGAGASEAIDREACRRQAESGVRAWFEVSPGAHRLGMLLAVLLRLQRLEARFDEAVEVEKLEAMAEFAAGAGHEINNPLAVIAGRAQLLLQDEPDPERRRELASINAQVKRAHEMIADMRLFARPPDARFQKVEMVSLVDRLLAQIGPQATERSIAIRRSDCPDPIEIDADPVQWNVALQAICRNAMEAIGQDGQIEISLELLGPWLVIRVADDGPGFSEQERRHLFDPFFSARQAGRGLGLGLSKCWRIAKGHGGRIEAANRPEGGALFAVWIPRGRQEPRMNQTDAKQ